MHSAESLLTIPTRPAKVNVQAWSGLIVLTIVVVAVVVGCFYTALFSALEQTYSALVTCDSECR